MPLELHEVTSADEFADVIHCEWVANETPWNGMIEVFCPTLGTGPKARQDSMKESTDRQWMWHESDPSSTWLNVIDTDLDTATATTTDGAKPEGGKVVAAAKWHIYKEDPFVDPASRSIEAYWWPEGEGRTFATTTLNNMMAQRVRYTRFPHVCEYTRPFHSPSTSFLPRHYEKTPIYRAIYHTTPDLSHTPP